MGSYSTVAFVLQVLLALVPTITALEESHGASGSQTTNAPVQCNVCWSLVSAAQCQNSSKSEPCSPEQLDSTVSKLRMIHPQTPDGSLPAAGQVPYRCFTLSATAGNGEAKQVFYAKGCTTTTADLCAGWAKAKSERAACTLCTGNNCNTAAPMEVSHSAAIKLNNKNCSSSNSNRAGAVDGSFNWMVAMTLLGSLCTAIFKQ